MVALHNPRDSLLLINAIKLVEQVQGCQAPVGTVNPEVIHNEWFKVIFPLFTDASKIIFFLFPKFMKKREEIGRWREVQTFSTERMYLTCFSPSNFSIVFLSK